MSLAINGARLLLRDALTEPGAVTVRDGVIEALAAGPAALRLRGDGLILAPGLVDIHGDAFERQVQPRPGVDFPHDIALLDTDAQLAASGITTALHGVTLSWEPGLRSEAAFLAFAASLDRIRSRLGVETHIHLRLEAFAMDALPTVRNAIASGAVRLVVINDHTAEFVKDGLSPLKMARYAERAKTTPAVLVAMADAALARRAEVEPFVRTVAALARDAGLTLGSHDDASPEDRLRWRALGCTLCEFPMSEPTGLAARAAGESVVMGCPNVVRGGSHLGWHSAEAMVRAGACDVLASDYYYPAMRHAAFALVARGTLDLPAAWALVSTNAARAAGFSDRGEIAPGKRADLVLLDAEGPGAPHVVATIAGGRIIHLSPDGAARLH